MTESLDPSGDQWEIRQLVEAYAAAADRADGAGLAALFTEDGELEPWLDPARDTPTGIRHGRREIAEAINGLSGYLATHHTIASSIATVEGDRATGECRCVGHHVELSLSSSLRTLRRPRALRPISLLLPLSIRQEARGLRTLLRRAIREEF